MACVRPLYGTTFHKSFTTTNIIEVIPEFSSSRTKVLSTSYIRGHVKFDAFIVIFCVVVVQEWCIVRQILSTELIDTIVCHKVIISVSIL